MLDFKYDEENQKTVNTVDRRMRNDAKQNKLTTVDPSNKKYQICTQQNNSFSEWEQIPIFKRKEFLDIIDLQEDEGKGI